MRLQALPSYSSSKAVQTWSRIIAECSSKGLWKELLHHHASRKAAGVSTADASFFPLAVKACSKLKSFGHGVALHADAVKMGLHAFPSVANSVMDFYIKCGGCVEAAMEVFSCTASRDSVSWNVLLRGLIEQGEYEEGLRLFMTAKSDGFAPNVATLVLVLQGCWNLGDEHVGWIVHSDVIRTGFISDAAVANSLLSMYARMGRLDCGRRVFDEMLERDVISWSAMITGYAHGGETREAFSLFKELCAEGEVFLDGVCVAGILQACGRDGDHQIYRGRSMHGQAIIRGFDSDPFVGNSLVDMYSKCLDVESSCKVFDEVPIRTVVTWNSALSGLAHNGKHVEAMEFYKSMKEAGVEADAVTLVILLQLCRNQEEAHRCKSIHSFMTRKGFEVNELALNTLLDSYSKCGMVGLALQLFEAMERKNIVAWSTMIGALARSGKPDEAISLFHEMKRVQEGPNWITLLSLMESCSVSADLERSKWAHCMVLKTGYSGNVAVGTATLEMYAKCGEIGASRKVFDEMPDRNLLSWSAMIGGYGMNGAAHEAVALFNEMASKGVEPNEVTFVSVLSACSHGGLVEEGNSIFVKMVQGQKIKPSSEHFSCMVDMLGRAGELEKAVDFIENLPQDVKLAGSVWGALLSACINSGHAELGRRVLLHVVELESFSSTTYQLAVNMYAKFGQWVDFARAKKRQVKEMGLGLKVVAGYSLVQVGHGVVWKFVAGDRSNPRTDEIYAVVHGLHKYMQMIGETKDAYDQDLWWELQGYELV